jgi:HK97 family phage major capsid protein
MLESTKIQRRQSEIRERLSALVGKSDATDEETREMEALDQEYRSNETKYRAALISEDNERRQAGAELETREGSEWSDLLAQFELRQAALHLDEGRPFDGATNEVVTEMRRNGGYRGCPIPLEVLALEQRAGETVASGTPDPRQTRNIVDRLFPASVMAAMGGQMVSVDVGEVEWPITTSSISAGWADSETGNVAGPTAYATTDRVVQPHNNLGVQLRVTRRALKQTRGLEAAIRRDLRSTIQAELDKAAFLGSGSSGEPLGVIAGASTYGVTETAVDAAASWSAFRGAVTSFMTANAASSPSAVRTMIRPEVWSALDDTVFDAGSGITEYDRLTGNVGSVVMSSNALEAPSGSPSASKSLLTTSVGGVAPFYMAMWGGLDLIRDVYTDAQSGGLRLTGLLTADVTISRSEQLTVLTGIQD